jgi:aldehyde:ferredoxin oxidoreductase
MAHCKGQDTVEGFRGSLGWALGVATSPVGGHHLRGAVLPGVSGPKHLSLTEDRVEDHAEAVFWQLRAKEIEDAAGICVFMGSFSGAYALEPSDYAALINAALGLDLSGDDLLAFGQRAYNLEKAFNTIHAGFERTDDYPPERFFVETVKTGPRAGSKLDRAVYDQALDRFYELNGWETTRGLQTREGLTGIGLDEVTQKLSEAGKLVD